MTRYQVPREETSINLTNISEQVYCLQISPVLIWQFVDHCCFIIPSYYTNTTVWIICFISQFKIMRSACHRRRKRGGGGTCPPPKFQVGGDNPPLNFIFFFFFFFFLLVTPEVGVVSRVPLPNNVNDVRKLSGKKMGGSPPPPPPPPAHQLFWELRERLYTFSGLEKPRPSPPNTLNFGLLPPVVLAV